jgi:hypothetical protein
MGSMKSIGETACREHMLEGHRITALEATILFGVGLLSRMVARMRREGFVIKSRSCTYAAVVERLRPHAMLVPPPNLPIREIVLTEYWVSR